MPLIPNELEVLKFRLQEGLAHFDKYDPRPTDDCNIVAEDADCSYEFAFNDSDCLRIGDLRKILAILEAIDGQ